MTLNNPMGAPRMSDGVCSCRCVATSNHGSGFNTAWTRKGCGGNCYTGDTANNRGNFYMAKAEL